MMNEAIEAGKVFQLKDLVPYAKGKIARLDIAQNDGMKSFILAFDDDKELPPHNAPGEALLLALDGKAVLTYEGKECPIAAGECFRIAKGALHSVKAQGKFKMALLLVTKE
jgi:quercetin dioxygenase-like cupin family protein